MRDRIPAALLAALVLVAAAHSIALQGPFQFDDHATIAVDPGAQSLVGWWTDAGRHVRPLTKLTFVFSHALGDWLGSVPLGHRLVNLLIHLLAVAAACGLGYRVARSCLPQLDARAAAAAATLAALVFGLHPLATEAVSYISGRSMALGTLLAVTSLWAYVRWRTGAGAAWCGAAIAACAGAMLARETALVTPLLWLLWEIARQDSRDEPWSVPRARGLLPRVIVSLAIIGAFVLWTLLHVRYAPLLEVSQRIAAGRLAEPSFTLAVQYFASAFALLRYPAIDPDIAPGALSSAMRLLIALALLGALAWAWRLRHTRPHLLFSLLWTGIWLAPLYAVPVRLDAIAERHFYPAIWGIAFALAAEAALWSRRSTGARTACATAVVTGCLALSAVTLTRTADYRSEVALWEAAHRSAPAKVRVLNNLGYAYMEAGRWDEALVVLGRAARIDPEDAQVQDNLLVAEQREFGPVRWIRPRE